MLLVDDWFETGGQALTAVALVEAAGAELAGASVIVDQLPGNIANRFRRYAALIPYGALPNSASPSPG